MPRILKPEASEPNDSTLDVAEVTAIHNATVGTATQAAIDAEEEARILGDAKTIAPTPLVILDDEGELKITHTDPIHIPEGFGGYSYWMAYTPYPGAAEENVRVVASNDGVNWQVPAGMAELIDDLAGAQGLGHIGWSDTALEWDGTKLWLVYRGYGDGITYTTNETIYLRQCSDGVNWTSRGAILTGASSTAASLLSPSIVKKADGTWAIYVVDNGAGGVRIYTSTNGTTSWGYSATCVFPPGTSAWHVALRLYGGRYYMLVNSRRGWALYAYHSDDGVKFVGRGIPFVPRTGTALDSGGHYRSGFYLSGGQRPMMHIYAVGMTGSTETINNASKTLRCYLFEKRYDGLDAPLTAWDMDTILMVDNFVAGQDVSASGSAVGDLRWSLYNGVGSGSAAPGAANKGGVFDAAMPGLSCLAIKSGATSGNITGIQFDHDNAAGGGVFPWSHAMITSLQQPTIRVAFRMESVSDSIWIGIGSANLIASPARFTGLQKTAASANWRFVSREAAGANHDIDSLKPATGGAGNWWRFEMGWNGTLWQMRIVDVDGYPSADNQGDAWIDVTSAINTTSGVNFVIYTMANSAAASELRVCKWGFRAFTGRF